MKKDTTTLVSKKWQVLIFATGISILLIISAYLYYSTEERTIRENKQQEIKAIAGLKISQITQWRKERIADTRFSRSPFFTKSIKSWLDNRNNLSLKKEIIEQLILEEAELGYSNIYLFSTLGECIISTDLQEDTLNSVVSSAIVEVVKRGQISFTDFYVSSIDKKIYYDIIAPVMDKKNNPVAALLFRIDPNDYLYPLIQSWPTPSKTSETLLVRKDGDNVQYVNNLRKQNNTALNLRIPLTRKDVPAVQAVLGYEGIYEGKDYRSVDVLAYIAPVPGTPWFMVAKVDKSEIYAELQFRAVFIGLFTIVLIFLTAVILVMIYNSRQKNIYRKLLAADKEFRESEEKFRRIVESSPTAMYFYHLNDEGELIFIGANPIADRMLGVSHQQMVGKTITQAFPNLANTKVPEMYLSVAKGELETQKFEIEYSDNKVKGFFEVTVFQSGPNAVNVDFVDISDRKKSEIALKLSEEKFRNLFEHSPIGKSITGIDGSIHVNNTFCEMLGYSEEELKSKKWQEISYPDDIQPTTEIIQSLLDGKSSSARFEKRYLHKNGNIVWTDVSTYLQHDEKGEPQFFITAINDISGRKFAEKKAQDAQTETNRLLEVAEKSGRAMLSVVEDERLARDEIRKLNQSLEIKVIERTFQLEIANKELEAFSYSVSHDLRAPLRHINGFIDMLTAQFPDSLPEKGMGYMNIIRDSARQMGLLIDDLLQFSRTGRQELRKSLIDTNLVFEEVLLITNRDAEDRKIEWITTNLPTVYCDQSLIKQVWVNLLSNAVKFTRKKEKTVIEAGYEENEKEFVFFVRDNGVGFDMKYANKLFGVFQRLHSRADYDGTGIGLANVQRIIHRHGGRVWAEAEQDKGAIFYFTLPKQKEEKQ